MLDVDDVIAFFKIGEVNVEEGTRGLGVSRFEAARTLDFVAAEDFGVSDNDELAVLVHEAASERADFEVGQRLFRGQAVRAPIPRDKTQAVFLPDLAEALAFAVVIAKYLHLVPLAEPAVHLREELAALEFCDLGFGWAVGDRAEGVESGEAEVTPHPTAIPNSGKRGRERG